MMVSVATEWSGRDATVTITGDVDLASAPAVDAAIEAAVRSAEAAGIIVDLAGVTFLDSSGISVLLRGRRLAEDHHVAYQVVGARGLVLTVLELTGVWAHLSGHAA
jgi:anti-sigma B factor antagonist